MAAHGVDRVSGLAYLGHCPARPANVRSPSGGCTLSIMESNYTRRLAFRIFRTISSLLTNRIGGWQAGSITLGMWWGRGSDRLAAPGRDAGNRAISQRKGGSDEHFLLAVSLP